MIVPRKVRFPWRAAVYGICVLYLVGDLFVFKGPLHRHKLEREKGYQESLPTVSRDWVAEVNTEPITRAALEKSLDVYLARRGKSRADVPEKNLALVRWASLDKMIEDTLVRQYARTFGFVPTETALAEEARAFESQFTSPEDRAEREKMQDLTPERTRQLLMDHARQRWWLEERVGVVPPVSEEEARQWFENLPAGSPGKMFPEAVRVRHLFLSTIEQDTRERALLMQALGNRLAAGEDLATLTAQYSEDERTKLRGGDLGWCGLDRMPRDFADHAFGLAPGQIAGPFRTRLGWHLVQLIDRRDARPATFEELKEEVLATLNNQRRQQVVTLQIRRLWKHAKIVIHRQNM